MAASHVVNGSTSISLPIPLFSTGHTVVGGWFRLPTTSTLERTIYGGNSGFYQIIDNLWCWDDVQRYALCPQTGDGAVDVPNGASFLPDNTWFYFVIDRHSAGATFWFLRSGNQEIYKREAVATQTDNETALIIGGIDGMTADAQHWWCYQGSTPPTAAQLRAMAQTTDPNSVFSVSRFWPLTDGSGTATIGGVNATSTATASSYTAPASTIASPDEAYSTRISRYQTHPKGDAYCETTPIAVGSSGTHNITTVSCWVRLNQSADCNAYLFAFVDSADINNVLILVCQHNIGTSALQLNTMSPVNGDQNVYSPSTGTEAISLGWLYCAWVIDQNGTNTTVSTYLGLGEGSTLALLGTQSMTANETFPNTWRPTIGIGANNYDLRHLRVFTGTTAPSLSTLQAAMNSAAADTSAWADWGLASGRLLDRSGNARHLIARADIYAGLASPSLSQTSDVTETLTISEGVGALLDLDAAVAEALALGESITATHTQAWSDGHRYALVDFGGGNAGEISVTGQATIASNARVEAWLQASSTAAHNEDEHRLLAAYAKFPCGNVVAGQGFTIHGVSKIPITGELMVHFDWSNP